MEQKKLGEANQIQQMQGLCEAGIPGNGREQEFPLTPAKNDENKENYNVYLNWYDLSRVGPCERARPQLSEYV